MSTTGNHKSICVCIPTYNRAKTLSAAIDSVVPLLSWCDLHIFDNASTDETDEVIAKYSRLGIGYWRSSVNSGYHANVNRCLGLAAEYDWVAILHSDDFYIIENPAELLAYLERFRDSGIVYGGVVIVSSQGHTIEERRTVLTRWSAGDDAIERCQRHIPCSATFYRSSAVLKAGVFSDAYPTCGDEEYAARIARFGAVVEIPTKIAAYRRHSENTMIAAWRNSGFIVEFERMRIAMNSYRSPSLRVSEKEIRRETALQLVNACPGLRALGERSTVYRFYKNLWLKYPYAFFFPKVFIRFIAVCIPVVAPVICRYYSQSGISRRET